jgi:hypothetical protein
MIGAVDVLESDSSVFRYSWFIGRGPGISNYPFIDLLGANGQVTELGQAYKRMPVHHDSIVTELPARIEAEAYNRMSGILLEKTWDQDGFANVGYIDAGDWLEYVVFVPGDTILPMHLRMASTSPSELMVLVDGDLAFSLDVPNTGGWQNWDTFESSLEFTTGEHTIRLYAATSGFNINWFDLGDVSPGISPVNRQGIRIHPNPAGDVLKIEYPGRKNCVVSVRNGMGQVVLNQKLPDDGILDISHLMEGMYVVTVEDGAYRITEKIIIK